MWVTTDKMVLIDDVVGERGRGRTWDNRELGLRFVFV
jgi:hypothetical protein